MVQNTDNTVFTTEDIADQGRQSMLSLDQVASLKRHARQPFGQESFEVTKISGGKRTVLGTEILSAFSQISTVARARIGGEVHLVNLANFQHEISDNGEVSLTGVSSKDKIIPLNTRGNPMSAEEYHQTLG